MALENFPFMKLPCELRVMIWEFCIGNRECLPEVHFLDYAPAKEEVEVACDYHCDSLKDYTASQETLMDVWMAEHSRFRVQGDSAGTQDDSMLWNICPESREVVMRHGKKYEAYPHGPWVSSSSPNNLKLPTASNDENFSSSKDPFLLVRPQIDLFCLSTAAWGLPQNQPQAASWRNFAYVYNPAWMIEYEERLKPKHRQDSSRLNSTFLQFRSDLSRMKKRGTLWLIDYRLQPTSRNVIFRQLKGGTSGQKHPDQMAVFRARDKTFVEVGEGEISMSEHHGEWYVREEDRYWSRRVRGHRHMSHAFSFIINFLSDYLQSRFGLESNWLTEEPDEYDVRIGVLGCVKHGDR